MGQIIRAGFVTRYSTIYRIQLIGIIYTHVKKCRPVPVGKHRKSIQKMEAVFQPESLRIFPDKFRPFTGAFRRLLDEFRSYPYKIRIFVCELSQDMTGKSLDLSRWGPTVS